MASFLRQLRWELERLRCRPRTYVGFASCLVFEVLLLGLRRLPSVRDHIVQQVWRVQIPIDLGAAFSGISSAFGVVGETMTYSGILFLALVAGDIMAKEIEDGTLRMVLSRPVSRTSVLAQKLIACAVYTFALVTFVFVTALALSVPLEGTGRFLILIPRDNLLGMLDFATALERYAIALPLAAVTLLTVTLLAVTLSCFPMKPGTATTLALGVLFADWMVHLNPTFAAVSPYCLSTRLGTWRQVFNDQIPWPRIQRNLRDLFWIDVALVAAAWTVFVRRQLTKR